MLGVSLVGWLGVSGDLKERLSTLTIAQVSHEVRLPNWCDALEAGTDFWFLGTGLGTYRYAYQPYQSRPIEEWFYHAENQYLEAFVEGGVVAVLLLLAAIVLGFAAAQTLVRSDARSSAVGLGVAGLFALTSQSVHAIFDFGLSIPANMLLFALICGAVTGGAAQGKRQKAKGESPDSSSLFPFSFFLFPYSVLRGRWIVFPIIGFLAVQGFLGFREVSVAASVDEAISDIPKLDTLTSLDRESVHRTIERLTAAASLRPDDAGLHAQLAKLWIYRYRLQTYDALKAEIAAMGTSPDSDLWELTAVAVLHQRANALRQAGRIADWQTLRNDPLVSGNLTPAVEHLLSARTACPILPRTDLRLAALAFLNDSGASAGRRYLERAVRLAPSDPDVLYAAGCLADHVRLEELAYQCWRQCLSLSERYRAEILEKAKPRLGLAEMVDRLLPQSPEFLLDFAREEYPDQTSREERRLLASKARQLIRVQQSRLTGRQRHHLDAVAHTLSDRPEAAVESYRRALSLAPFKVDWRLELAKLLQQQGRIGEALEEARICASLAPKRHDVRCCLSELSRTGHR